MPFKSAKQRAYLFIHEPKLAKEWANKYGTKIHSGNKSKSKKSLGEAYMSKK